jgi:hypothetical protein
MPAVRSIGSRALALSVLASAACQTSASPPTDTIVAELGLGDSFPVVTPPKLFRGLVFSYPVDGLLYGTPAVSGDTVVTCEHLDDNDVEELTGIAESDLDSEFGETCHAFTVNHDGGTSLLWTSDIDSSVESSPVIAGDSVYANTLLQRKNDADEHGSGGSIALDLASGALRWRYKTKNGADASPLVDETSGLLVTGVVYNLALASQMYEQSGTVNAAALGTPYFFALNIVDGTLAWKHDDGGWAFSSVAMDRAGTRLLAGSADHTDDISAIAAGTWTPSGTGSVTEPGLGYVMDLGGNELWPRVSFANSIDKTTLSVFQEGEERYVFGTHDSEIVIFRTNGEEVCRFAAHAESLSSPVTGPEDTLINVTTAEATTNDKTYKNKSLALSSDCRVAYQASLIRATTPLVTSRYVYAVSAQGMLKAYDHSLNEVDTVDLREESGNAELEVRQAGLTITASGVIVVAAANGMVLGVRTSNDDRLLENGSCPKFRCNRENTGKVTRWE